MTSTTDTAVPATSVTSDTINAFVQRHSGTANSDAFSSAKSTAQRLGQLGFGSSANSRVAEFLEDFRATPHLSALYEEQYPQCYFLPWRGLHRVLQSLGLWFDSAKNYAGAVPEEQLPWLEIFELQPEHRPRPDDFGHAVHPQRFNLFAGAAALVACSPDFHVSDYLSREESQRLILALGRRTTTRTISLETLTGTTDRDILRDRWTEFCSEFFVVAPREAFTTAKAENDWFARTRQWLTDAFDATLAPDDPLVVRPVHGGVLVVAAWGDEAAELNKIARDLKV